MFSGRSDSAKMNYGGSYQNSGGYGMVASGSSSSSGMNLMSETEYQRLSQTVGTNIQKMIQNGELMKILL